ncbi:MAG: hypothetical protein ACXWBN_02880 [Acidimicrobiales bacterium]
MLVWEPKRVVPTYAVPVDDVAGVIGPDRSLEPGAPDGASAIGALELGDRPVLDPTVPFAVHTVDGAPSVVTVEGGRTAGAFVPSGPDLADYVVLGDFDEWFEEEERNVSIALWSARPR